MHTHTYTHTYYEIIFNRSYIYSTNMFMYGIFPHAHTLPGALTKASAYENTDKRTCDATST